MPVKKEEGERAVSPHHQDVPSDYSGMNLHNLVRQFEMETGTGIWFSTGSSKVSFIN